MKPTENITWHNPHNLATAGDGWRFLVNDEHPPKDAEYFSRSYNSWCKSGNIIPCERYSYRTREPLPEKYRQPAFTPIPPGLPPLPEFDCTTHWWAYRGTEWVTNRDADYAFYSAKYFITPEWSRISSPSPTTGQSGHYIELVAIDYSDEAYREYVRDAFEKGSKIEHRSCGGKGLSPTWRTPQTMRDGFFWHTNDYRIAQPAPEKPVDQTSREYKLSVLTAALDGKPCEARGITGQFFMAGFYSVAAAIADGRKVRIKPVPTEPVMGTVPLEAKDIPPVCWLYGATNSGGVGALVVFVGTERIQIPGDNGIKDFSYLEMMQKGFRYSTDRITWKSCSKQVERKG